MWLYNWGLENSDAVLEGYLLKAQKENNDKDKNFIKIERY